MALGRLLRPLRVTRATASKSHAPRPLQDFEALKQKVRCLRLKTQVGQEVLGHVVSIYCPSGVSVDVGCQTLAFLEVEATAMVCGRPKNATGVWRWLPKVWALPLSSRR